MELYHGSYAKVEQPQIIKEQYTKDFGTGFYCTILKEQAERWAGKYDSPWVNVYEYTKNENLRILEFKELTDDWLDFVVACRAGQRHDYDIVIGAMADDQIYNYVADYIRGAITREQFINTTMMIYNSWISRKNDNYNSSMYYENPAYLFESYKAGTVLA